MLINLHGRYGSYSGWSSLHKQLRDKLEIYTRGTDFGMFEKDSKQSLRYEYLLLLECLRSENDSRIVEYMFLLEQDDSYEIIKALEFTADFLGACNGQNVHEDLLSSFAHFSILMSKHRERNVKYWAVMCLIALTHYATQQKFVLKQLSRIMDCGTPEIKTAIITCIKKIKCEDPDYIGYILKKASVDNHYRVRQVALSGSTGLVL